MPDIIPFIIGFMYSSRPGLLIGFHGCEQSIRNDIVSGKIMLRASQNKYDWLGQGFYFWENNYARVLDFAIHPPGKKQILRPAVLGGVLDMENCLDLMNTEFIRMVKNSFDNLKEFANILNKRLPVNKTSGVRAVFVEGVPLYKEAGFHEKNHVQICIRNPNCIKGFPRREIQWTG